MWKLESTKFFIRYQYHIEHPRVSLLVAFNILLIPIKLYLAEHFVHKKCELRVYLDFILPVKSGAQRGQLKCNIRGTNNQILNRFYEFVHPQLFNVVYKFDHLQLFDDVKFFFSKIFVIFRKQRRNPVYRHVLSFAFLTHLGKK